MQIKEIMGYLNAPKGQGRKPISQVALLIEGINEKSLRAALKKAGCQPIAGNKGWECKDVAALERDIFDYAEKAVRTGGKPRKKEEPTKVQTNEPTKEPTNEPTNVQRKRASFDLDVNLLKQLKVEAALNDENIYEIVERALRMYLGSK